MDNHKKFLQEAVNLSIANVKEGKGGPFGVVIVKNNEIIARGTNQVTAANDPTAHAEIVAIRNACKALNSFQLTDCFFYTSCEPCPMCMGAVFWSRLTAVYFGNTREDAAKIGFDDSFIYEQLALDPEKRLIPSYHLEGTNARDGFDLWHETATKISY